MSRFLKILLLSLLVFVYIQAEENVLFIRYRNSQKWEKVQMHWGYNNYEKVTDIAPAGKDAYGPYF